tara:strand:+ start:113 stop:691 length:579 start_codon:yes stop_codon:yes gene_type:complete
MIKKQLNFEINVDKFKNLKKSALSKGISITELLNKLVDNYLSTNKNNENEENIEIKLIKKRLEKIELQNKKKVSPFTNLESKNCTYFMKTLFQKVCDEKYSNNKNIAWIEFIDKVQRFEQWDDQYEKRLKAILINDEFKPWKEEELNKLTMNKNCQCPIYAGLWSWSSCEDFPSQQEICDKGDFLVPKLEFS